MAAQGWYNGSTHVHMNYGGVIHNTPESLLLMARAQGMNIVSWAGRQQRQPDSGLAVLPKGRRAAPGLRHTGPESLLLFGEENRPPFWGHTFYMGCAIT